MLSITLSVVLDHKLPMQVDHFLHGARAWPNVTTAALAMKAIAACTNLFRAVAG